MGIRTSDFRDIADVSPTDFGDETREYRQLLYGVLVTVLLVLVLTLLGQIVSGVQNPERLAFLGLGAILVGLSYTQVRRSIRRGAGVLIVGLWLIVSAATVWYAGVHSANILIYAFLIVLTGWIMGTRWLTVVSVSTILLLVGLGAAEYLGVYRPTPRAGVLIVAGSVVGCLVAVSFLTSVAYRSLAHRRDRAMALSNDLARQNLEIAQRERDLQLIMEHIPVGLTSLNTRFDFRFVNARYAATFGKTSDELMGKNLLDWVPPSQLDTLLPLWKQCLAGQPQRYRRNHVDPVSGAKRIIEVELVPETNEGTVTGLFGVLMDVTDAVAAQDNIRVLNATLEQRVAERTAELEAAMDKLQRAQEELARSETKAALSTMIASVSHELSTPLGNSLITANTLVEQSKLFGDLVQANQLKRSDLQRFMGDVSDGNDLMQRNLQRAAELLKNFRQVANDQASEQRRVFDLAEVFRDITQALAPSLKRQPHRIVLEVPSGIAMDSLPGALGQVIINLINNAYVHAFDGREDGVLTIRAQPQGQAVAIAFIDNGSGMSAAIRDRLFEPFFTTKKGRGGTGLGMNIVQNLVTKTLGGSMDVRSSLGKGTTVELHLPLIAPAFKS